MKRAVNAYVDPGVRYAGLALFDPEDGGLVWAGLLRRDKGGHRLEGFLDDLTPIKAGYLVVGGAVEHMRIRPETQRKGDQNDLVDVAFVAGSIGPALGTFLNPVTPETWKGQVPKEIMVRRVMAKLSPAEHLAISWPSKGKEPWEGLNHNVADAVGIGAWDLRGVRRGRQH